MGAGGRGGGGANGSAIDHALWMSADVQRDSGEEYSYEVLELARVGATRVDMRSSRDLVELVKEKLSIRPDSETSLTPEWWTPSRAQAILLT